MENENATIKLVEALVSSQNDYVMIIDSLATLRKDYDYERKRLYGLIDIILNNSRLNYDESGLAIKNDDAILQYLIFIAPDKYEDRLESLKDSFKKEARASKTVKGARKDGK